MSHTMKLYSYFRSSCSYRVRIALNYKGLDAEYIPVHLVEGGGQQFADDYTKRNPMAEVPSIELFDDAGELSATLAQSMAILEYIEETHPEPPLLPTSAIDRAKVRQIAEIVNSGIQPIQNLRVMKRIAKQFDVDMSVAKKWAFYWIEHGFRGLEPVLAKTAGTYAFGDQVTFADLMIVPQVYNANRFKIDMSQFPTIARVAENALALEAFQKARPAKQPDTPEDLKE